MKQKNPNWFFRIFNIFFIMYVALFISHKTGYYEKTVRDKTIMTEEMIAEFEKDVENNIAVDIKDYLPKEKDYSNFFTKSASSISSGLGNLLEDKVAGTWKFIKSLFIG